MTNETKPATPRTDEAVESKLAAAQEECDYLELKLHGMEFDRDHWMKRAEAAESNLSAALEQLKEREGFWIIYFEDRDRDPELYTDRQSARKRWEQISVGWNAHLLQRIECNFKDNIGQPAALPASQEKQNG